MVESYRQPKGTITLSGATGSFILDAPVEGELEAVVLEHNDGGGTVDVTFTALGDGQPDQVLTVFNNGAKGWSYPRKQAADAAGALITGEYVQPFVTGYIQIDIAQGTNGAVFTAWAIVRRV